MATTERTRRLTADGPNGAAGSSPAYSIQEDQARTNEHYEQPAEFFATITGGEWNVYSCNLWESASSQTESQERKLDRFGELLDLRPNQRILDVGCGWGGPLVYLARRFGVKGVGLTLSATQKRIADARAQRYGVDVNILECHWADFSDSEGFDAVYTDEVIVHFHDLLGFFAKSHELLRPGGRMLNKELHFASSAFNQTTRTAVFVNAIYGETGNYRTLHEELALLDQAGFVLDRIEQLSGKNYQQTLDSWLSNMQSGREELEGLVGRDYYRRFRTYLKLAKQIAAQLMTIDVVVGRKPLAG